MKKIKRLDRFFMIIAFLLLTGFFVRLGCDYYFDYIRHPEYSAPFYAWVLVRSLEFILPGIICFITAFVLNRRRKKGL